MGDDISIESMARYNSGLIADRLGSDFQMNKHNSGLLSDVSTCPPYMATQKNGQTIYRGPTPDWRGGVSGKGTEVYCYKIPQDCYEDELIALFSNFGPIFELRLMTEFTTRSYCYVRYTTKEHAEKAICSLDSYEIRRGHQLAVDKSVDKQRLWIHGIPKNWTSDEFEEELGAITSGICHIILYSSQTEDNRPYMLAEYQSKRDATQARRKLRSGEVSLFGVKIGQVSWVKTEPEEDEHQTKYIKILYVRHLDKTTTMETIRNCFNQLSNSQVRFAKKPKEKESAELVMDKCNQICIDDQKVDVDWAFPPKTRGYVQGDKWQDSLLRSMADPSQIVFENKEISAILDMYPKAREHYMVLPKEDIMGANPSVFMMGFHAEPHLNRLHLHVISKDLDSVHLYKRHHWNIFTTPYFISWRTIIEELEKMGKVMKRTHEEVIG